jgi:methylated-DNA-[protein]-cysteine S-methyltransferase
MKIITAVKVKTIHGLFFIHEYDHKIVAISKQKLKGAIIKETPLLKVASKHLIDYFNGKLYEFDLPIDMSGTPFQVDVYKTLLKVGYGQTTSYQELAKKAGYPKAYRAVGTVMANNNIPFIIPCHRVIKSDGSLGNYVFLEIF